MISNSEGKIIAARSIGTEFKSKEVLANFCVDCFNFDYVRGETPSSQTIYPFKSK